MQANEKPTDASRDGAPDAAELDNAVQLVRTTARNTTVPYMATACIGSRTLVPNQATRRIVARTTSPHSAGSYEL